MTITELKDRFEFYAINHVKINHSLTDRKRKSFFHVDIEEIQQALTEGVQFPALFLQTPEVEKTSAFDNISENFAFTFVVLFKHQENKTIIFDQAKAITDSIYNRISIDILEGILPGIIEGSDEGKFGPIGDGVRGWGVSIAVSDGYNGEVKTTDWRDLA